MVTWVTATLTCLPSTLPLASFPHHCNNRPQGEVLLLLRAGKRNAGKWGLPGGNVDDGDTDLLATAKREAAEELGGVTALPPYVISGDGFLTK